MSLGHEFTATEDEPGAVAPSLASVAYFEAARAALAVSRGIPLCTGARAFLASAQCSPDMLETTQ
jgi:hypothetical protein